MTRLRSALGCVLALGFATGAMAQSTPQASVYAGLLYVTSVVAPSDVTCSSSDPTVGTSTIAHLNNSSATEFTFAFYSVNAAIAWSLPWTTQGTIPTSGTLTQVAEIHGGTTVSSSTTYSYTATSTAITVLDPTTGVISFTLTIIEADTCQVTISGVFAPTPSSTGG
ncbi:MAG TPA: hypothetical protein VKS60_21685 [Stellaceae bacterium]|nr:hypothetical protein [Stellaceae bacterium]